MIRLYKPEDQGACIAAFRSNCPKYFMPDEEKDFEVWLKGQNEGRLAYANTSTEHYFVIEINGSVVGCGGYYIVSNEARANLVWGMIHSDFLGKGYGTLLYNHRVNNINELYPGKLLTMDTSQHTYGFYEKMGLVVTAFSNNGYGIGLHRYDMK